MKNVISAILLLSISTNLLTANPFGNEWIGELFYQNGFHFFRVQPKDGELLLKLPFLKPNQHFKVKIEQEEDTFIQFSTKVDAENWFFSGTQSTENEMTGTWTNGKFEGKFTLYCRFEVADSEKEVLSGYYQSKEGNIFIVSNAGNFFRIHSPVNKRVSMLRKIGEHYFHASSGEQFKFSEEQNGKTTVVERIDRHGKREKALRYLPFKKEEVRILTSKDTIAGSLFLPNRLGKHPACLMVQGAGNYPRWITNDIAEFFAAYGFASLSYDKPGTGKSSGEVYGYTFEEKRDLNLEIFDWLKSRPEIDADKVGLRGASQGGRIATMVAAERPETAFLIAAATPMESLKETRLFAIHQFLRQQNFTEVSILEAGSIWLEYFNQIKHGTVSPDLLAEAQKLMQKYPEIHIPRDPNPPNFLAADIDNATIEYLPKVSCPILAINGALDERVPVQNSVQNMTELLKKNKHPDFKTIFYPGANHSFMLPGFQISPGFYMDQINWVLERVNVNPLTDEKNIEPEIVLPNLVSTEKTEFGFSLTPNGKIAYFTRRDSFFTQTKGTIYFTQWKDESWTTPEIAPFSGEFSDGDVFITADGKRLFFTSNRPIKDGETKKDKDIWYMKKTANGWGNPIHLPAVNSTEGEYSPTLTKAGDLYFGSTRKGGEGWGDIYVSKWENGKFQPPKNIGTAINTKEGEWGSCVSPEGDYLIFEANGRTENLSYSGDLFISYFKNNAWQPAKHLKKLNSTGSDLTPKLSPDGKHLYFASNRHQDIKIEMNNENVEIYRVALKEVFALEE